MDISLDLAGDGELVAVESDPAQVGQQVGLGGGGGTSLCNLPGQHVQLLTSLATVPYFSRKVLKIFKCID